MDIGCITAGAMAVAGVAAWFGVIAMCILWREPAAPPGTAFGVDEGAPC